MAVKRPARRVGFAEPLVQEYVVQNEPDVVQIDTSPTPIVEKEQDRQPAKAPPGKEPPAKAPGASQGTRPFRSRSSAAE